MGTLKNTRTKFQFWLYNNISIFTILMLVFLFLTGVFFVYFGLPNIANKQNAEFLYFLPFVFVMIVSLFILKVGTAHQEENYLITIYKAEKFRKKKRSEGVGYEICEKLFSLIEKTKSTQNSKELTVWMNHYQAWEKYQKALEEKRKLLEEAKKLPLEIAEMEKNTKTLYNNLVW